MKTVAPIYSEISSNKIVIFSESHRHTQLLTIAEHISLVSSL